jgi:hypothetical protein
MKKFIIISVVIVIYTSCINNDIHQEFKSSEAQSIMLEMCLPDYFDTSFIRYVGVYGYNNWKSHKVYTNKNERIIDTFKLDCFPLHRDSFPLFELRVDTIFKDDVISYDKYYDQIFASTKVTKVNYVEQSMVNDNTNHHLLVSKHDSLVTSIRSIIWSNQFNQYGFDIYVNYFGQNDQNVSSIKISHEILKCIEDLKLKTQ